MSSKRLTTPPSLSKAKNYDDWLKLVEIWQTVTDLETEKQGPVLLLSLEGDAQEVALKIDKSNLIKPTGVKYVTDELDKLYKKDDTLKNIMLLNTSNATVNLLISI